ncbi:MAG: zinc dependent phospholipase C family protein [Acholeplasmatales bacterium]|nr:zinc dependent phospholipase C family protein [Acholeplasmatales bacterium]
MNSLGHIKLITKSISIFNNKFPNLKISDEDIEILKKGVVDPDHINKTKGSHYAIYDKKTDSYHNRIKGKKDNAFSNLIKYYDYSVQQKSIYYLGFALHFVMDMLTIPHATGIQIAPLYYFGRHRKYERYTTKNMEKYFIDDVEINNLLNIDIKELFRRHADEIDGYKDKLKKSYYDEINNKMIPLIITYTVLFLYKYYNERSVIDARN